MNKTVSLWLIAMLSCISLNANAVYVEIDGLYFELSDSTATLTYKHWETNCYWGEINIPENVEYEGKQYSVTSIGSDAFSDCTALTNVNIPKSIKKIEDGAFSGCTALVSLNIPGTVTYLGKDIFGGCNNLRSVTICDGTEELRINQQAWKKQLFKDCRLTSLYLGRNILFDGAQDFITNPRNNHYGVFTSKSLESLTISNNVTKLCYLEFAGCEKLEQLSIPSSLKDIGLGAFADCYGLTTLNIDNPLCTIEEYAFWDCISLNTAFINVKSIGVCSFSGCSNLRELTIGKDISKIEEEAFYDCTNLIDLYCLALTPPLTDGDGKNIFKYVSGKDIWGYNTYDYYNKNVDLHVPMSSIDAYSSTEPWKSFKSITGIYVPVESINLSTHDLVIGINSTFDISCTFYPEDSSNNELIWTSSDDSIVSVNDGRITANDVGTACVYVTSKDNQNIKDSCFVTVIIPVTGISLSTNECTLNIGSQMQLEMAIFPIDATNKNVIWSSSNDAVCSVENGLVTALSKGTAIITVMTEEGEFCANCIFTVIQPVTGIFLSQSSCLLTGIGDCVQLEAFVQPEDASNKEIKWNSSNETICMVSQGMVIATGFGTAVVIASTVDGGFLASCVINVEDPSVIQDVIIDIRDDSPIYDLMGIKVKKTIKGGLYIQNGQKYIAK